MLFERHADMDASVGEVLEGPIRVPMLKVQRTMLRDMYHPKVSEMNRTALLRYIYMTQSTTRRLTAVADLLERLQ